MQERKELTHFSKTKIMRNYSVKFPEIETVITD